MAQELNRRINLYSETSASHFRTLHITHSLTIAARAFPSGARVVDWGTGGGMPGLPLAILFPEVEFVLIDAVGKKIRAVQTMARRLGLGNVVTWHGRAEHWTGEADYSVSRATAPLDTLWRWHCRVAVKSDATAHLSYWQRGLVCLKGGDLQAEVQSLKQTAPTVCIESFPIEPVLDDPHFRHKVLMSVTSTTRTESLG